MIIVFFFYGLSFFLLGAAISLQSRKGSEFRFGKHLWLLAVYGLLHGSKEWLEMFTMIGGGIWNGRAVEILTVARFFLAQISFIFLFLFGLDLIVPEKSKKPAMRIASVSLICCTVMLFIVRCLPGYGNLLSPHLDAFVRYCFAFPAIGLTGVALFRQKRSPEIRLLDSSSLQRSLSAAAVLFVVYAVLDGLFIEHESFYPAAILSYQNFERFIGMPVQVFRILCAFGILYCMLRILNVFEIEKKIKLENAYKEIINTSTREQERIGQDIHDGLCQQLTGVLLNQKVMEKRIGELKLVDEAVQAKKISELLNQAISHSRTISKSLFPVEIEEHGLADALRDFAENAEEVYGIACTVRIDENAAIKDHTLANHLFRIAQESVNNSVKHGKATDVTIALALEPDGITALSIADNGSGISLPADNKSGMGLNIMRYRSKVIGGKLTIDRLPQGGTRVTCTFKHRT